MATQFVPVSETLEQLGELAAAAPAGCPELPEPDELSDWVQQDYDLDANLAQKLGFSVATGTLGGSQRLLIREFSRSSTCEGTDGKRYRYGTAVRLVVKINNVTAGASLTIPFVAAETQLARMQAESTLRVVGYVGEGLAGLLPPFRAFNVDTYAEMSTRMNEVKQLIGEDIENVRPTRLGVEVTTEETLDLSSALGLVWGLTCISKRRSCAEAKRSYPDQGSLAAMRAIEQAYGSMPSPVGCTADKPSKLHEAAAKEMLRGLELKS